MIREMNKNEFMRAWRGYHNAQEMFDMNYFRECLLELKPAISLQEKYESKTRFLAKAYYLKSQAFSKLNKLKDQKKFLLEALRVLEKIDDETELKDSILKDLQSMEAASHKKPV